MRINIVLDDILVSVLFIGSNVSGLKHSNGRWIFKGDPRHDFIGGEERPSFPCCKILRNVEKLFEI
jgi:hypothetical protein